MLSDHEHPICRKYQKWFLIEGVISLLILTGTIIFACIYVNPNVDKYVDKCRYYKYTSVKQNGEVIKSELLKDLNCQFRVKYVIKGEFKECLFIKYSFNCSNVEIGKNIIFWRNRNNSLCLSYRKVDGCDIDSKYVPSKYKNLTTTYWVIGATTTVNFLFMLVTFPKLKNNDKLEEKDELLEGFGYAPLTYLICCCPLMCFKTRQNNSILNENSNSSYDSI